MTHELADLRDGWIDDSGTEAVGSEGEGHYVCQDFTVADDLSGPYGTEGHDEVDELLLFREGEFRENPLCSLRKKGGKDPVSVVDDGLIVRCYSDDLRIRCVKGRGFGLRAGGNPDVQVRDAGFAEAVDQGR